MATVKISSKNQVVVPKEAREHLGVGPGDELLVVPRGDGVVIVVKPRDHLRALAGSGKGLYGDAAHHLKRERKSWDRRGSRRR